MADRLTQLQDCLDQLATQMFASLHYIASHHPITQIPSQPYFGSALENQSPITNGVVHHQDDQVRPGAGQVMRDDPAVFDAAVNELAQDLVAKERQIELLVNSLPGRSRSQAEQEERMQVLDKELRDKDAELEEAAREKTKLVKRVESMMWKVRRY